ncbi:aromatic amino acid lyase [Pseudenhygromyxa sp. WMMC2535]|uniref:HAL/PAL/TAL family ammonia-lyase n=1 Tax=Pseudenhygromyxa sp. WMMC2535 TaxID=2712867 RepID=UPI001554D1F1|nr:aromatic amino acid ammonia-lyase [Pseudenhygromyxa sp. WMMC2535]NVB42527.1 aromatic amino acid lyase [Pseudenhygromyxa sp. WMMC2535]
MSQSAKQASRAATVEFGAAAITVDQVLAVADGRARVSLSRDPAFRRRLGAGAARLAERLAAGERVYGVTTGFGESCVTDVPADAVSSLPLNLLRFHGCGTGRILDEAEAAAVVTARLASLVGGWSAVRPALVERLVALLDHRALPRIPAEGSVGASGDLTPLSYVAALLVGERECSFEGRVRTAAEVHAALGLEPLRLVPKESLAIMNGTSVMTGLVCLALGRARRLARLSAALTAAASDAMLGNPAHFDARIFAAKPHPGQAAYAAWVREDLEYRPGPSFEGRIQDRYSIRCAPHVAGVLLDALPWMTQWTETELNGANDNPLIDPESGEALHGGNFYGGHACFVADGLKNLVANLADLHDRQLALLCSSQTNNGLPENLNGQGGAECAAHHGFKAMQIAASALAAEALKNTMPASVFSRSTECHNQDKVSMGTIAAREALRVVELTEQVVAIVALAAAQAVDLRERAGGRCHPRSRALRDAIRERAPFVDRDRRQDGDIAATLAMIRSAELPEHLLT